MAIDGPPPLSGLDAPPSVTRGGDCSLPLSLKLGYGAGEFGIIMLWQGVSLFLLFFLTDVLGMAPAVAGLVIMLGLIWDGFIDLAMGVVADRTRSRWGRYRPYLLFGAAPLGAAFAALFWIPSGSGAALIGFALATQLVFRLAFTVVAIPFGALSSAMTRNSEERASLVGFRMLCSALGSLTVALSMMPLVQALGGGDRINGFRLAAFVLAIFAVAMVWVSFAVTREAGTKSKNHAASPPYKLAALPGLLMKNTAFLCVVGCVTCSSTGTAVLLSGMPYILKYGYQTEGALGAALGITIGGVALFIPVWLAITKLIGKRNVWIFGALWSSVCAMALAFMSGVPLPVFLATLSIATFGFSAITLTGFSMLPDTVEFGEWRNKQRLEAALYSALILAQKVASGLAAGLIGAALAWVGYVPEAPLAPASAELLQRLLFLIPAGVILFSVAIAWRYPISSTLHARLVRAIAWRATGKHRPEEAPLI